MTNFDHALAGELTADGHRLVQRVYYEDTDFSGFVYHARYLHFMERARTDYLRCLGVEQGALSIESDTEGLMFVVHRMEIDFKAPAKMDDILTVLTHTEKAGGAKMVLQQEVRRGEQLLIAAKVVIAVINAKGRPRRLPDGLAAQFLSAAAVEAG
ncbi:tol-pal system-associated acyl-CoA thioesterase [Mycoplana ramosa]|uniref:Tol-pal system-associated acyl-CoA thioesterase n=1 Tax=Mycoplana ramosa TaxID=40837 RepID=A0ABW3YWB1_MYCRA